MFRKIPAVIILAGLVFYGGFALGRKQIGVNTDPSYQKPSEIKVDADFSLFWDSWKLIRDKHIWSDAVNDKEMVYGAISGLLGSLDDPYSVFMEPSDAKKFEEDVNGIFGGIGAEIGIRASQLVVVAPLKGTPAERAGLKGGDKILKVDSTPTIDLTLEAAIKIIRGEPNTKVLLTILRDEWAEPKEIAIVREVIKVPTLDSQIKVIETGTPQAEGGSETRKKTDIAYVQLYSFNQNAPLLFYEKTLAALIQGARGMILDLRNNPGGYLEVATNLAGWFMDRGETVVIEKLKSGEERELRANGNGALKDLPVVVLVNGGSASASEILAGALKINQGAKLVGEKTFGKGTVQELDILKDGSQIKISIAEWLLPDKSQIDKKGIEPDVAVKLTDEDAKNKKDPQLDKAIEILREEIIKQ